MKIYVLAILGIMLSTNLALSQNHKIIKLTSGLSIPIEDFAAMGTRDDSGYAKMGWNVGLESVYFFNDWLGAGANYRYSNHPFDQRQLATYLTSLEQYESAKISANHYNSWTLTVGPYFMFKLSNKFTLLGKTSIGALCVQHPDIKLHLKLTENGNQEITALHDRWVSDFAYNLGLALVYWVSPSIGVTGETEYTNGKPDFTYLSDDPLGIPGNRRSITFQNVSLGVSYYFR